MPELPLRLANPEFLLLLPVIPLTWWIARRSLAGLPRTRRILSLGLRIIITLCLILACAGLQWCSVADDVAVYFLLDWSDSIPANPPEYRKNALQYMVDACKHKQKNDRVGLIYFGSDPTCEQPPDFRAPSTQRQAVIDTDGTDIAAAIRLALFTFPPGVRKRIVLVSDGNQNRGDALAEVEAARQQGIRVDVYPIQYTYDREILVQKLILPDSIQEDIPFKATTVIRSTHNTRAQLTLRRAGRTMGTYTVNLKRGRNVIPLPAFARADSGEVIAGLVQYSVQVAPLAPGDDHIGGNNSGSAFTRVHGPPAVLYVDGNIGYEEGYQPRLHMELTRKLHLIAKRHNAKEPVVKLHLVTTSNIPSPEALAGYDCIILDNVPAEALQAQRMEKIRTLVNDQGVGLVMIGGERSFGAGNYLRTPIEQALPVDMDLKHKKVMPNGALVITWQTYEFPNGNWWMKRITGKAIDTLGANDFVGVICWGGPGATWVVPIQKAVNRVRMKRMVRKAQPFDGHSSDALVKKAVDALRKTPAAVRHIIMIGDGDGGMLSPKVQQIIKSEKRLTLSTVCIDGFHNYQSWPMMRKLAMVGGGRAYKVTNPSKLPRIFVKEAMVIKKSLIFEEAFTPIVNTGSDMEFISKFMRGGFPRLYGYVATTAKPVADVPLVALQKDATGVDRNPVLAHWRYGLGQAVAFTSDAKNRWSKDWLGWSRFGDFWAEIIYRILREQPANLKMDVQVEGERGHIAVDAVDHDGNPIPFLTLTAAISTPSNKSKRVRLRQVGVGRYEADFQADEVGDYQVAVRSPVNSKGPVAAAYGGTTVPHSAETERLEADTAFLSRLAGKGGGRILQGNPEKDLLFSRDLPAVRDFHDWWPWLLALAAILFPLDVFTRRVMIDWAALHRWAGNRYRAMRGLPLQREERMSRLMQAKQAALHERTRPAFLNDQADTDFDFSAAPTQTEKAHDPTPPAPANTSQPEPEEEPAEQTYTSRLLKAKRRAMEERKRRNDE